MSIGAQRVEVSYELPSGGKNLDTRKLLERKFPDATRFDPLGPSTGSGHACVGVTRRSVRCDQEIGRSSVDGVYSRHSGASWNPGVEAQPFRDSHASVIRGAQPGDAG